MTYIVLDTNYIDNLKKWNQQVTTKTVKLPLSMTFTGKRA